MLVIINITINFISSRKCHNGKQMYYYFRSSYIVDKTVKSPPGPTYVGKCVFWTCILIVYYIAPYVLFFMICIKPFLTSQLILL